MPEILYIVFGVVVLAAIIFYLRSKKSDDAGDKELESSEPAKLSSKPSATATSVDAPAAKTPAAKAAASDKTKQAPQKAEVIAEKAEKADPADKAAPTPASPKSTATAGESGDAPSATAAAKVGTPKKAKPARAKDVAGLRVGLARARESEGIFGRLKALFVGRKEIDPNIAEAMEEVLLSSDVGVATTGALVDAVKTQLSRGELTDEAKVWDALRSKAVDLLELGGSPLDGGHKPTVVMVVGVNGVGKTTTIGKLATRLTREGSKVVLAAGDTFRAAAVNQLVHWGKRAGCEVVTGAEGANAGAVIFDAIQKAKEIGADVVLADTAGRLHTKSNLMDELKKISRTMTKAMEGAPHETLLVLDSTNGQNAIAQTALFKEALPLSGIVLTKLDGTAKGGVILGIAAEHKIPVRFIGVGEKPEDLRDFDAAEFVEALLGTSSDASERAA